MFPACELPLGVALKRPMCKLPYLLFALCLSGSAYAQETGELFVSLEGDGSGRIYLDGMDTGNDTPAMLRDVEAGSHQLQVLGECQTAGETIEVAGGRITRSVLTLEDRGGFLELVVEPDASEIFIDGDLVGMGPNLAREVGCGRHTITVEAIGHKSQTRNLNVDMGSAHRMEISLLTQGHGSLSIMVEPLGATVFIDGHKVADGPITLDDLGQGEHELKVLAEGFHPHISTLTVEPDVLARVDVQLDPVVAVEQVATEAPEPEPAVVEPAMQELELVAGPSSRAPRYVGGAVMTTMGATAAFFSWRFFQTSLIRYDAYKQRVENNNPSANAYYDEQYLPTVRWSTGLAIASGASFLGAAGLFFTADLEGNPMVGIAGRW